MPVLGLCVLVSTASVLMVFTMLGGTVTAEFILLTRAVPPADVGGVTGLASAANGISGAVISAVTTALLAASLVHVAGPALPAPADYSHAWLAGAATAAAGALTMAVRGVAESGGTRPPSV